MIADIGDRLIEVVGLENCLHMGQVRTGLRSSGKRLAQCSHVIVKVKRRFPMQVDGEPWEQPPGTVMSINPILSETTLEFMLGQDEIFVRAKIQREFEYFDELNIIHNERSEF